MENPCQSKTSNPAHSHKYKNSSFKIWEIQKHMPLDPSDLMQHSYLQKRLQNSTGCHQFPGYATNFGHATIILAMHYFGSDKCKHWNKACVLFNQSVLVSNFQIDVIFSIFLLLSIFSMLTTATKWASSGSKWTLL